MIFFYEVVLALLLFMMAITLVRAVIGPTVIDRLVAVNMIGTKTTVIIVIMGIIFDRLDMFVDIAIGYGLLNFIASVAAAKFFQSHTSMHPESVAAIQHEEEEKND